MVKLDINAHTLTRWLEFSKSYILYGSHQKLSNDIYFVSFRGSPHFPNVFANDIIMTSFGVAWFANLHILWNFQ